MSKILLLLAAVAALAIAASAAPDFNDLDTSDLDASAVDDSDLDGIDADDLLEDSDETDEPVCAINQFINTANQCQSCEDGRVVPYGENQTVGDSCFSCPLTISHQTEQCISIFQHKIMRTQAVVEDQSKLTPPELEKIEVEGYCADCVSRNYNYSGPHGPNIKLQMTSCASATTCCLPGYYGASSLSCTLCPSNKPSSPFSAPNSNCECPNSGSNKCFACTNKCKPYDSQSRMCLPVQCPSGQTCKTISNAAQCVSG
jgi:hypothetical protein